MQSTKVILAAVLVVTAVGVATTQDTDVPNIFSAGDTISASQMNENFDTLETALNGLSTTLNDLSNAVGDLSSADAWIAPTLLNNAANYDPVYGTSAFNGDYSDAGYVKDPHGTVYLRGVVQRGTDFPVFTLPAGYRPAKILHLYWPPTGEVIIKPDGNVLVYGAWASLDGVSFRADQ